MIEIAVSERCLKRLRRELRLAGAQEIGGVLAGEHLADGRFLVVDLSVQRTGGGFAHFERDAPLHRRFMRRFFARTGHQYARYNYLGEWHSHPSFVPWPSSTDIRQMQQLVEEGSQTAMFLALMVVKLDRMGVVEGSAHAFRPGMLPLHVELASESGQSLSSPVTRPQTSRAWLAWRRERAEFVS